MNMAKLNTFCMISFLLLLTLTCASSRPMGTPYHDVTPMEHSKRGVLTYLIKLLSYDQEAMVSSRENSLLQKCRDKAAVKVEVDDKCEGLGEEECLMRRTLEAHLDYIYTQRHKQP